jgi:hypothetical protein
MTDNSGMHMRVACLVSSSFIADTAVVLYVSSGMAVAYWCPCCLMFWLRSPYNSNNAWNVNNNGNVNNNNVNNDNVVSPGFPVLSPVLVRCVFHIPLDVSERSGDIWTDAVAAGTWRHFSCLNHALVSD